MMSLCILCNNIASNQENKAPYLCFCDTQCQNIHYALIHAGVKRERDENNTEGVDFTQILPVEVLEKIFSKFDSFESIAAISNVNPIMKDVVTSKPFIDSYFSDNERIESLITYFQSLMNAPKTSIKFLIPWITRLANYQNGIYRGLLFRVAIQHEDTRIIKWLSPFIGPEEQSISLYFAIDNRNLQIVKYLLRQTDPWIWERKTISDVTNTAIEKGSFEIVRHIFKVSPFRFQVKAIQFSYLSDIDMDTFLQIAKPSLGGILQAILDCSKTGFRLKHFEAIYKVHKPHVRSVHMKKILRAQLKKSYFVEGEQSERTYQEIFQKLSIDDKLNIFEKILDEIEDPDFEMEDFYIDMAKWILSNNQIDINLDAGRLLKLHSEELDMLK